MKSNDVVCIKRTTIVRQHALQVQEGKKLVIVQFKRGYSLLLDESSSLLVWSVRLSGTDMALGV